MSSYQAQDLLDRIYKMAVGSNAVRNMSESLKAIEVAFDRISTDKRHECVRVLRMLRPGDQSETDIVLQKAIDIIEGRVQ